MFFEIIHSVFCAEVLNHRGMLDLTQTNFKSTVFLASAHRVADVELLVSKYDIDKIAPQRGVFSNIHFPGSSSRTVSLWLPNGSSLSFHLNSGPFSH